MLECGDSVTGSWLCSLSLRMVDQENNAGVLCDPFCKYLLPSFTVHLFFQKILQQALNLPKRWKELSCSWEGHEEKYILNIKIVEEWYYASRTQGQLQNLNRNPCSKSRGKCHESSKKKTAFPFIHYFSLSQRVMVFLFAIIYQTACRQWMCSIVPSSLEDNK